MEVYLGLALLVVVVIVAYVKFIKPVKDAEKKGTAAAQNEKIRRTLSEIRRRNSLTKTPPTPAKKGANPPKIKVSSKNDNALSLKVIFYSQTGTAEDFANRLSDEAKQFGFEVETVDAENYKKDELETEKFVVFACATYGEGDPPDNAKEFHEWLMNEERPSDMLKNTRFAVFGLGNKTYEHFNKIGKDIDKRLEALGGARVCKRGEGDDDANIEEDFVKWKKIFFEETCNVFKINASDKKDTIERKFKLQTYERTDPALAEADVDNIPRWSPKHYEKNHTNVCDNKNPYLGKIVVNRELHKGSSDRSCRHVEVEVPDWINYETGDHIGIFPTNDPVTVEQLARRLQADLDQIFEMKSVDEKSPSAIGPCTLRAALMQFYDLNCIARKPLLKVLSQYAADPAEKDRLASLSSDEVDPTDPQNYNVYIQADGRTILEVLESFSSVKVPLDHFLEELPKLQAREYSISSSPDVHGKNVHITAVLVDFKTPTGRRHMGLCTSWFARNTPAAGQAISVPMFIGKSTFRLPKQITTPVIMVGPGTGFAPFRGFLHQLTHDKSKNPEAIVRSMLFFGCRRRDCDFIYEDEVNEFSSTGIVSDLHLAFSREKDSKVYVQHRMSEAHVSAKIYAWLEDGGYFYICGDAKGMAVEVRNTLKEIIKHNGSKSEAEAEAYLENLSKTNRYLADIWA